MVPVKAENRVLVAEGRSGSLATFPPPHAVFWARQAEENLGYVFYRKDSNTSFSMGTRQPEQEGKAQYLTTFPLINARPGTLQHMGAYFYASPLPAEATRQAVLGFTHGDTYKPVAGYKTMVNHLHLGITARLRQQDRSTASARHRSAQVSGRQYRWHVGVPRGSAEERQRGRTVSRSGGLRKGQRQAFR